MVLIQWFRSNGSNPMNPMDPDEGRIRKLNRNEKDPRLYL